LDPLHPIFQPMSTKPNPHLIPAGLTFSLYRVRYRDSHNWVVDRKINGGKWKEMWYYTTLEAALMRIMDRLTGEEMKMGQDVMAAIASAKDEAERICEVLRSVQEGTRLG